MLNHSVQSRFGNGDSIGELQSNPIDGFDQSIVVDRPPLVARKRTASCCQKGPWNLLQDRICSYRYRGGWHRTDLHWLKELSDSVSIDDPRDGSDRGDLARLREGQRACGKSHLVRQGNNTHTPTWHANYRQKMLGSPPRGIPRW